VRLNASRVILACRSLDKGEAAKLDVESATGRKGVLEVWQVDLTSYDSVKEFCKKAESLDRLDCVLENAGLATPTFELVEGSMSSPAITRLMSVQNVSSEVFWEQKARLMTR
jgi:retinol dehydrogenase-12